MYDTYNEVKSVVVETFIRTLKNKIYKHMTSASKNVYFDVLNDINTNQKEFRIEKVIKRKGKKLYVKWKGYYNSFNS